MNADEFRLMTEKPSADIMDAMTTSTLDEWTAAIETVKTRETGQSWFIHAGVEEQPVPLVVPVDKAACANDAILLLHAHRMHYISNIPDSAYWLLQHAENHLNDKLTAYVTRGSEL